MTTEHHQFFLDDWKSNHESIAKQCGTNWKVVCDHCGVTLGGSSGNDNTPPTTILWKNAVGWFGQFQILE